MLEVFCPSLLEDGNFPQAERENDNIAMVTTMIINFPFIVRLSQRL